MAHSTHIAPLDRSTNGHLPAIVAEAAKRALPMIDENTAAAFGTDLMDRLGAVAAQKAGRLTPEHTTLTFDEGMIAYRTAPIESELRDLDASQHWGDASGLPWLAAEVVIHAEEPTFGRQTQLWLSYGVHTGELSPAQGREALKAMREFADRYEQLLDYADQVAADDTEAQA